MKSPRCSHHFHFITIITSIQVSPKDKHSHVHISTSIHIIHIVHIVSHNQVWDISHRLICMQCSQHDSTCMWYRLDIRGIIPNDPHRRDYLDTAEIILPIHSHIVVIPIVVITILVNAWTLSIDSTMHNFTNPSLCNFLHYIVYHFHQQIIASSYQYIHTSTIHQ